MTRLIFSLGLLLLSQVSLADRPSKDGVMKNLSDRFNDGGLPTSTELKFGNKWACSYLSAIEGDKTFYKMEDTFRFFESGDPSILFSQLDEKSQYLDYSFIKQEVIKSWESTCEDKWECPSFYLLRHFVNQLMVEEVVHVQEGDAMFEKTDPSRAYNPDQNGEMNPLMRATAYMFCNPVGQPNDQQQPEAQVQKQTVASQTGVPQHQPAPQRLVELQPALISSQAPKDPEPSQAKRKLSAETLSRETDSSVVSQESVAPSLKEPNLPRTKRAKSRRSDLPKILYEKQMGGRIIRIFDGGPVPGKIQEGSVIFESVGNDKFKVYSIEPDSNRQKGYKSLDRHKDRTSNLTNIKHVFGARFKNGENDYYLMGYSKKEINQFKKTVLGPGGLDQTISNYKKRNNID